LSSYANTLSPLVLAKELLCGECGNLLATCHCEGAAQRRLRQSPFKRMTLPDERIPFNGRLLRQKAARSDTLLGDCFAEKRSQ